MAVNLNRWITHGAEYTFWGGFNDAETVFNGTATDDLTDAEESHMAMLDGIIAVPIVAPGAESLDFTGDNGSVGTMIVKPQGAIEASTTARIEDQTFAAYVQQLVLNVDGDYDELAMSNACKTFRPICAVVNSPAQSAESATKPAGGYDVTEIMFASVDDQSGLDIQSRSPREFVRNMILSERAKRIDGSSITTVSYGVGQAFVIRYWSPNPIMYGVYIGDGNVAQTFTVPYALAASTAEAIKVVGDGTPLVFTTDYTAVAATGVVTFTIAGDPASAGVNVYRAQLDEAALCS